MMIDRDKLGAENRPSDKARKVASEYTDKELALAQVIREAYISARTAYDTMRHGVSTEYTPYRKYDHGEEKFSDGKTHNKKPVWPILARRFFNCEIEPRTYIFRLFESIGVRKPPEPAELLSPANLERYRAYAQSDQVEQSLAVLL